MKNQSSIGKNAEKHFSRRSFMSGAGMLAAASLWSNDNAEGAENREQDDIQSVRNLQAIDVHAHYGTHKSSEIEIVNQFVSGDAETVIDRARKANTRLTVVSPLKSIRTNSKTEMISGNIDAAHEAQVHKEILQWVVVDPLTPQTYDQAAEMLKRPTCAGIKIHPERHHYPITEQGRVIFEFAAKHKAVILTHSGQENSIPGDFVPFANDFPEVTLILAHLGNGYDGDPTHQVRAIQAGKHDNMFVDTSSKRSIISNLIEWAVKEIGAERILYGTDSPLFFAPMHRARIDNAYLGTEEKSLILFKNAERILNV